MRPREVYRSVDSWLDRAAGDLRYAAYSVSEEAMTWGTCYHSPQAAEKALKGYLVWLGETRIPRTHDLQRLAKLVVQHGGEAPPVAALEILNAYSAIRYPEEGAPDLAEAEMALQEGRRVVSFVHAALAEDDEEQPSPQP